MNWEEEIESLKKQQKQAEEIFIKCQGAIEVLSQLKEKAEEKDTKKDTKKEGK